MLRTHIIVRSLPDHRAAGEFFLISLKAAADLHGEMAAGSERVYWDATMNIELAIARRAYPAPDLGSTVDSSARDKTLVDRA
jgi:hypothetical protein